MPIQIEKLNSLQIGVQGENAARPIEIDMTAWADEFPDARFYILFKPYNSVYPAVPVVTSYADNILTWIPTSSVTAVSGVGYAEVRAVDGATGLIKKTRVVPASVENSVSGNETSPPAAYAEWVDSVRLYKEAAEAAAQTAVDNAELAIAQAIQTAAQSVFVDTTLTIAGRAADAKAAGDRMQALEARITTAQTDVDDINAGDDPVECTALSISAQTHTFTEAGDTYTLTATPTPSNTTNSIVWTSTEPSVATVENGVVTAIGNGTATITAYCGAYSASCAVTVDLEVHCTGITLSASSLSFNEPRPGTSQKLRFILTPANTTDHVSISESHSSVIMVSVSENELTVYPVENGTSTITVTCGDASATCAVSVSLYVLCSSITLGNSTLVFTQPTAGVLYATLTPVGTTEQLTWTSSDTSVITVGSGIPGTSSCRYQTVGNGTALITATCGNCTSICAVTVNIDVPCTGITLSAETLTFTQLASQTLTATVTPANTTSEIVWTSSDPNTVTVENGVITPRYGFNGVATIFATCGAYTATCAVAVRVPYADVPAVGTIRLTPGDLYFTSMTPQAEVMQIWPAAGADIIVFGSTDTSVCTVSSAGLVTPVGNGSAIISASAQYGASAHYSVTVNIPASET
jgi:uncharacterized protein YjdB